MQIHREFSQKKKKKDMKIKLRREFEINRQTKDMESHLKKTKKAFRLARLHCNQKNVLTKIKRQVSLPGC